MTASPALPPDPAPPDAAAPDLAPLQAGALELDHVVIAVRDLQVARSVMETLGFAIAGGGRHPGFGTENLLVRLPTAYLELIHVVDPDEARATRVTLLDQMERRGEGFVAFALRGVPLDGLVERASAAGMPVTGPIEMSRVSQGGERAAWRLGIPYGDQYAGWWPFFIEWEAGGPRSPTYLHPDHPNGAHALVEVTSRTTDLEPVRVLMESVLGLAPPAVARDPNLVADVARYRLAGTEVAFAAPAGPGPLHAALAAEGEGVHTVRITSSRSGATPASAGAPGWARRIVLATA